VPFSLHQIGQVLCKNAGASQSMSIAGEMNVPVFENSSDHGDQSSRAPKTCRRQAGNEFRTPKLCLIERTGIAFRIIVLMDAELRPVPKPVALWRTPNVPCQAWP